MSAPTQTTTAHENELAEAYLQGLIDGRAKGQHEAFEQADRMMAATIARLNGDEHRGPVAHVRSVG